MKFRLFKYFFIFLFILTSCSTEKNTFLSRSYHDITSHYNIYFNGTESYKRGVSRTEKSFQDNYSRVLPVFYFSDPAVGQSVSPDMQRALEKATKVITLHSITAKPELKKGPQSEKQKKFYGKKEYNRWIDDNYLLIGKAYVYKNDFSLAVETFKKLISDFPGEESVYEALIWMARAYNEMKEYREAGKILSGLEADKDLPRNMREGLYTTLADHYIKQSQFDKAIPNLERVLKYTRRKIKKIRYSYILGQLYQETGNSEKTIYYFRKVIKMNPPYEMTFNAKINMAASFEAGSGKGKEFSALLAKMLKDDKNKEYLDQIYYALGNISMKQGKEKEAIEYYSLSASKSLQNLNQKGLSYLAIADIYYAKPDYAMAQAYYDSSIQNIDQKHDDFEEISQKAGSLNNLVSHLDVFVLEDSLQRLASMDEKARFEIIDKIIAEVAKKEEEERKRQQKEMEDMQFGMQMENMNAMNNTATEGGKWYFYNMNAKSFGQPEFRMKWGNRKLEDNWRRKNKQSLEIVNPEDAEEGVDSTGSSQTQILSNKSREFYLKDIPLNDSSLEVSHQRTEKALYNMGLVYMDELKDPREAIKSWEEDLKRYPSGEYAVLSAYKLYEYYQLKGPADKAQYYRNFIIRNFPDSPRAKILSNPEYVQQLLVEQNRVNVMYEETYSAFNRGDYNRVIQNADYAMTEFRGDPVLAKFRLLRALSVGKLRGNEMLTPELQKIIDQYPGSEEALYAGEILKKVYAASPQIAEADTRGKAEEIYRFNEKERHYFAVSTSRISDLNQLNFNLINFNLDNFNRLNLSLQTEDVGNAKVIFVRSFDKLETASAYFLRFQNGTTEVFKDVNQQAVSYFLISDYNYKVLKADKDLQKYYLYFRKYYQP